MSPFVNVKQRAGRPRVRVQGQVAVLCLLPSRNLSRLPSSPQRGFQPQTSPRPDKAVTALLRGGGGGGGGWIHTVERRGDLQGRFLQQDRMKITDRGCWHRLALAKRVTPRTVASRATGPASYAGCFPRALCFYSARSGAL